MSLLKWKSVGLALLLSLWALAVNAQDAGILSVLGSSNPAAISQLIQSHHLFFYIGIFFVLGLFLAFTPCVLPMVPILSGIIVGQDDLSTNKAFRLSVAYVMGMAVTYAIAGMIAGMLGSSIQAMMQQSWVIVLFSLIFVLMALSMFGLFELRLPAQFNTQLSSMGQSSSKKTYINVFLMGVLSTLVVSPCVTAPLVGVLSYIGQTGQVMMGGLILFVMAIGMGIPLLLVGAGQGRFLPKTGAWMNEIKVFFGVLMLAMAIWMLSRALAPTVIQFMWAGLLIIASIALGALDTSIEQGRAKKVKQGVMFFFLIAGSGMLFSLITATPASKMTSPQAVVAPATTPLFRKVATLDDLNRQLANAKARHQAAFIEFFATWCSDCQAMDKLVFSDPSVRRAMQPSLNLRVDISNDTFEVKKIKKAFQIYGTPTMVFYNDKGEAIEKLRSAGFVQKSKFIENIQQIT